MPRFKYTARKGSGEVVVESVEAESPVAVAKRLATMGLIAVRIDKDAAATGGGQFFERITTTDIVMFTRQLVTLYKAGLPFLSSLDAIGKQTSNPALRRVVMAIRSDVEGGTTLSAALAKHPKVFSEVYVSSVLAGETGGVLAEVMQRLVFLLENEQQMKQAVKSAMRYPLTVVVAMTVAFLVIVTFVIPTFSKLFSKAGMTLPFPTRVMVGINEIRQDYWHVCVLAAIGVVVGLVWYVRTPAGRLKLDKLVLKFPLVGSIIMKASMARIAHMFGTLSRTGLPILKELGVIARTIGNLHIAHELEAVRDAVREGSTLAAAVESETDFPPLIKHMIAVGEKTGAMAEMMEAVGEHYDRETKAAIGQLTQAIEPLITVVLGCALVFLALAVFLPMWDMIQVMAK